MCLCVSLVFFPLYVCSVLCRMRHEVGFNIKLIQRIHMNSNCNEFVAKMFSFNFSKAKLIAYIQVFRPKFQLNSRAQYIQPIIKKSQFVPYVSHIRSRYKCVFVCFPPKLERANLTSIIFNSLELNVAVITFDISLPAIHHHTRRYTHSYLYYIMLYFVRFTYMFSIFVFIHIHLGFPIRTHLFQL